VQIGLASTSWYVSSSTVVKIFFWPKIATKQLKSKNIPVWHTRYYKQLTFCSIEYLQPRIRGTGVDSGRILRFSFRPGSGAEVKNLWKTGPGSGVTFHFQQQEPAWFSYIIYHKQKHWWISVASMVAGVWTGVGFPNLNILRTRTCSVVQQFRNRSGVGVWKCDYGHFCLPEGPPIYNNLGPPNW